MFTLNARGKLLTIDRPQVMGIINRTTDSFYSGSRFTASGPLLQEVAKMVEEGVDWLDIGGQSTRPGAADIGEEEEMRRVVDAIGLIHQHWPWLLLSVDTWYSRVAREAVAAGASMVNDISGGRLDPDMLGTVGTLKVPYVCMHMKGTPATMNKEALYEDVTKEVLDYFIRRIEDCRQAGIHDVILDPGFGFAKNSAHNFTLLRRLQVFAITGRPLLVGLSRKSTIYRTLGITPEEALNGTTVMNTIALLNGATFLRVHDVRQAKETIALINAYNKQSPGQ
jgi:dihydropteroate synthase